MEETKAPTPEEVKAKMIELADNYAKKLNTRYFVVFHNLASYEVVGEIYFAEHPEARSLVVHTTEDHTPADQKPRGEHLAACQQLAKELLDNGRFGDAWRMFESEMKKHPGTALHPALKTGTLMLAAGQFQSTKNMRDFIGGFK
jgi:hypothetical protein